MNLLQQQSNRLECVEKNQERIPTEVATQIEEARRNKCHTKPVVVDDTASIRFLTVLVTINLRTTTEGRILPRTKTFERRRITLQSAIIEVDIKDLSPRR